MVCSRKLLPLPYFPTRKQKEAPALCNDVHIVEQGVNFFLSSNGNIGEPNPRHNAAFEGVEQSLGDSFRYLHGAHPLFQVLNIVLNQLRPIVQSQDRVGKFVKQLLVDAVHQNGEHQAGGAHPAIVPAIQEALEQSVLLLAQGRLGGFPFWHCHFRGWIRFAFHGFLFHNQLILGHGSIPADFGQLGIVNADLLILGGLFLRQKPTGLFLYELQNPFGIQHPFDRVPVGIAFPHHRIYGLDQSNQLCA